MFNQEDYICMDSDDATMRRSTRLVSFSCSWACACEPGRSNKVLDLSGRFRLCTVFRIRLTLSTDTGGVTFSAFTQKDLYLPYISCTADIIVAAEIVSPSREVKNLCP